MDRINKQEVETSGEAAQEPCSFLAQRVWCCRDRLELERSDKSLGDVLA